MRANLMRMTWLVLVVLSGMIAANAQQDVAKVTKVRIIQYHGDMAHLLAVLADSDQTVIGLETDPKKPSSWVTIDLKEVNLRGILDGIVQSEPLYQWRETNGSIEVVPVNKTISLIDAAVNNFEIKDLDGEEAINKVLSLPEVQVVARSMKLNRRPIASAAGRNTDKKISLNLHNVNVRQVLTRIAAESGARFWVYRTFPDGSFSLGTAPN